MSDDWTTIGVRKKDRKVIQEVRDFLIYKTNMTSDEDLSVALRQMAEMARKYVKEREE